MQNVPSSQNSKGKAKSIAPTSLKQLDITTKVSFWVPIYLRTLALFCWVFGTTPDESKVSQVVQKGIKVSVRLR